MEINSIQRNSINNTQQEKEEVLGNKQELQNKDDINETQGQSDSKYIYNLNSENTINKSFLIDSNFINIEKPSVLKNANVFVRIYKIFKAFCIKKYRTLVAYYYEFTDKEKIFHYAASLSFYSIFSIIPLLLMLFSIVSSFPSFQNQIQTFKNLILENILPDSAIEVSSMLDKFLLNGREMGFLGFLISLVSSFIFFRNFDDVSARIFKAKKRSFFDSFIIYWLLITLIPLFAVTSIYFNSFMSVVYVINDIYEIMPMLATWVTFVVIFRISANKALKVPVLFLSSLFGAAIWYILKSFFFYYMLYNKFYSTIYGSISLIMFVFLWIYVSWLVLLISMRICKKLDDRFPYS